MSSKIYLDCTMTVRTGLNTGIQRVVRNISCRGDLALGKGKTFIPIICLLGRYYRISLEEVSFTPDSKVTSARRAKEALELIRKRTSGRGIFTVLTHKLLLLMEKFLRLIQSALATVKQIVEAWRRRTDRVYFEKDSTVVFLDSFWLYNVVSAFKRADHGVRHVTTVVYDLIPILHPEYMDISVRRQFGKSFLKLSNITDSFLCISQTVAEDVRKYLSASKIEGKKITSFTLGSDFHDKKFQSADLGGQTFPEGNIWLVVGTLEPRKNHKFILDAFDVLWKRDSSDILVIVGRAGWMYDELIERIQSHPCLNTKLFYFSSVSDLQLSELYRRAKGLILASYVEGFGLPIVEALEASLPVLCSDIPIFREVGRHYVRYFSLENLESLVDAITAPDGSVNQQFKWPTWDDSAKEFIDKLEILKA
ncbi:glycosyltransferase family 4 protein [Bdellovibrio sp. HCB185ZH]|uniref:glycosyltransferase family 4 protein n=1 Tax=Bdellovibrio sp. HCB185ZH TaxID=3394235 RepID=UPI0039A4A273